jgi:Zn-dependent alcohol dehydrogenase
LTYLAALFHQPVHFEARVDLDAGLFGTTGAGDDTLLSRDKCSPSPRILGHEAGGEVAEREHVLG